MTHLLSPDSIVAALPVAANVLSQARDLMRDLLSAIESVVGNWGVAIILLTIIVRLVIFPLTWKQIRSQLAMQSLAPKIKELQQKHKGDKQKLQQETMRLYQEYRINPLASCLPLLLQMPIFILLYYSIRRYAPLESATFLWFTLGQPDPYYILLVIYVASQLVSTELMLTPETQAQQKWMMRAMPLIFVAFLYKFPSGLFVYWITTNLWTVGQMMFIRYWRKHHPVELVAAGPSTRKQSRFLQAMQQAQQDRGGAGQSQGKAGQSRKGGSGPSTGKKGARPGGKPGSRPPGKAAGRPAPAGQQGRPAGTPQAKPGTGQAKAAGGQGRPGGQPQGKPGTRPAGQSPGRPGARPGGKPGGRPQGKPGTRPGGARPSPGASSGGSQG